MMYYKYFCIFFISLKNWMQAWIKISNFNTCLTSDSRVAGLRKNGLK